MLFNLKLSRLQLASDFRIFADFCLQNVMNVLHLTGKVYIELYMIESQTYKCGSIKL